MLIGLGIGNVDQSGEPRGCNDEPILKSIGCHRIFLAFDELELRLKIDEVIHYLRHGDVLAVVDLARIGNNLESIVATAVRLREVGAGLHAERHGIVPGQPLGDHFLEFCAIMSEGCSPTAMPASSNGRRPTRTRGRPSALSPDEQARAGRLLQERRASVIEVARLLKVSPATIYRYFPRGQSQTNVQAPSAKDLEELGENG